MVDATSEGNANDGGEVCVAGGEVCMTTWSLSATWMHESVVEQLMEQCRVDGSLPPAKQ